MASDQRDVLSLVRNHVELLTVEFERVGSILHDLPGSDALHPQLQTVYESLSNLVGVMKKDLLDLSQTSGS